MSVAWFKFYPADWRADPALRMCSIAARGLWVEMLCVMHEAEPRGHMLIKGATVNDRQLASLAGIALKEATACLAELEAAGVFSREGNVIFSRRMCRDTEKAERDKANGKGGGNPHIKPGVNPHINGRDKAQKPEARSQEDQSSSLGNTTSRENDRFEVELRDALGDRAPPAESDFTPIAELIAAGHDFVADVLPACRSAASKATDGIGSWRFYAVAIGRKAKASAPSEPVAWLSADSPRWGEMNKRSMAEKRRPLLAMGSMEASGVGAFVPKAWLVERSAA